MFQPKRRIIIFTTLLALALFTAPLAVAADVPLMTKEELKAMMDTGDVQVLDVRAGRDWDSSEFKIQGSQRPEGKEVAAWAGNYAKDKPTVLYCA